ncbi:MAG: DR2241 family protein [Verrucomicrobiota bacterium]
MRDTTRALSDWLAADFRQIGQIAILKSGAGFELLHFEDRHRSDLALHFTPADARALSTYTDEEQFRPLKSAPNLRHGWKLRLQDVESLRVALDFFYPAMLGTLLDQEEGTLRPVSLRETLGRQSGMYAVTKKITDEQADAVIGGLCDSRRGCLKTILWPIASDRSVTSLPDTKFDPATSQISTDLRTLPLLCCEACNLLVAAMREAVKKAPAAG